MRQKESMYVIEDRETGQRYLFDLLVHSAVPYLNEYRLVTARTPLNEKYYDLPYFTAYK